VLHPHCEIPVEKNSRKKVFYRSVHFWSFSENDRCYLFLLKKLLFYEELKEECLWQKNKV